LPIGAVYNAEIFVNKIEWELDLKYVNINILEFSGAKNSFK
jgi:hypothetical protein